MNRWTILAVLFNARIGVALAFQAVAAVLPFMVAELGLSYTQGGTLIGLFMLPGVVLAIPAGWLAARFGDKPIVMLGLAAMALGSFITAQASGFGEAAIGRVLAGMGGVSINVLVSKMTIDWFTGREVATAMAMLVSSWPLGLAIAMVAFAALATAAGWASALHVCAAFGLVALVMLGVAYKPAPQSGPAVARPSFRIGPRSLQLAGLAGTIWSTFNVGAIVFLSFSSTLLIERGWSTTAASGISSLLVWLCVPLIVLGGRIADRTGRGDLVVAAPTALTAALMAAMPFVPGPLLFVVLIGVLWAAPAGPIMSLLQILPAAERASGFGVFFTLYYLFMALLPPVAGGLLDSFGTAEAPLLFAALIMASTVPLLWLFRALAEQREVAPVRPVG